MAGRLCYGIAVLLLGLAEWLVTDRGTYWECVERAIRVTIAGAKVEGSNL